MIDIVIFGFIAIFLALKLKSIINENDSIPDRVIQKHSKEKKNLKCIDVISIEKNENSENDCGSESDSSNYFKDLDLKSKIDGESAKKISSIASNHAKMEYEIFIGACARSFISLLESINQKDFQTIKELCTEEFSQSLLDFIKSNVSENVSIVSIKKISFDDFKSVGPHKKMHLIMLSDQIHSVFDNNKKIVHKYVEVSEKVEFVKMKGKMWYINKISNHN